MYYCTKFNWCISKQPKKTTNLQERRPDHQSVRLYVLAKENWYVGSKPYPKFLLLVKRPVLRAYAMWEIENLPKIKYNLPPRRPARSSAAARCLFWSLSFINFSTTGLKASKGSSSRSWTTSLWVSEKSKRIDQTHIWIWHRTHCLE